MISFMLKSLTFWESSQSHFLRQYIQSLWILYCLSQFPQRRTVGSERTKTEFEAYLTNSNKVEQSNKIQTNHLCLGFLYVCVSPRCCTRHAYAGKEVFIVSPELNSATTLHIQKHHTDTGTETNKVRRHCCHILHA